MRDFIITLELLDWGASVGGEHICGTLKGYVNGEYKSIELKHPLSRSEALYLNK